MNKINLFLSIIAFLFIKSNTDEIFAQANKKKPPVEKEIIVNEPAKNVNRTEDTRDADDDDRSDKPDTSENILKEKSYFKIVNNGGVILREKPKPTAKKILVIPDNTIGEVLDETKEREIIESKMGNWLKVNFNGKIGWIFSGFTIIKEDKEDFLPLTLLGYFLIKSSEPIFYRKPGREILGVIPDYPEKGEIVPVYKKKVFYENEYYFFELKSPNPNSEEVVSSWIGAKSGSFLSPVEFSAHTLKTKKKKLKRFEKEILSEILKTQTDEKQALNYTKFEIQVIPFKDGSKKKKAYIVGYPIGAKTKKGFGNFHVINYLVWKEGETYHSLLAGDKKGLKIQDIDKDGIPEILALFETRGEPPLCHIYKYQQGMFEQLFPNYLFCDTIQIPGNGTIEIQKEKQKIVYKYSKGNLEKVEADTKPVPVPIQ